jgi:hypothetical protein
MESRVILGVHLASKSGQAKSFVFIDRGLYVIDICCLGCKRSRVQISAARPNSSKILATCSDVPANVVRAILPTMSRPGLVVQLDRALAKPDMV